MDLEIGVRLEPRGLSGRAPTPEVVAALPRIAARVEAEGLHAVWLGEEWPAAAGLPAALPLCAALGAATRRIRIGTAVVPLPLHHPLRVAEDAATVDQLSRGRLDLGVGLGSDPAGLADFGVEEADRVGRFEEALTLLRLSWAEEPLDFHGRYFQVAGLSVHPKPFQAGGPPLWVGARAPAAQARAAERGAGLLLPRGADPGPYLEACAGSGSTPRLAWIAAAESLAGGTPGEAAASVAAGLGRLRGRLEALRAQVILGAAIATGDPGGQAALGRAFEVASRLADALG